MPAVRRLTTCAASAVGALAVLLAPAGAALGSPALTGDRPAAVAGPGDLLGAYESNLNALKQFGMDPFLYPTAAAFCNDSATMGLVPAVAGAVPGPWPKTTVAVPGLDLTAVDAGQTMFTFVPYGISPDKSSASGMRVVWLNLSTGRSGTASLGPIGDVVSAMVPTQVPAELRPAAEKAIRDFFLASVPLGGIRAVPVDTGKGTVLAAVFGSVQNGARSCYFLPTVGVTSVP
ncbi:hypothetical protein ACTD5D_30215 [Nocardia takedensis]|uniref:hypothetical protein n=1 Tax=Nocardia takedensis TaxID=259390 RepID=UPI00059490A8|nr:hypothetical protein [Nocardia takedensis]